nr:hypothetical protein [Tanacetum cinerariifolium]
MDPYLDEGIGYVIVGEPFCKASCVEARRFDGIITIPDGDDSVTYQLVRSNPRLTRIECLDLDDIQHIYALHENKHGLPRMLGSIDYGFYPQWSTFVKSFTMERDEKTMKFKRVQESSRKDIERAFGVLQDNMILKDQKFKVSEFGDMFVYPQQNIQHTWVERCEIQRRINRELRDRRVQDELRRDIVEHLWNLNH